MGLWEQFPYANTHELNLDWIINELKRIVAEVQEVKEWESQHKGEYEELLRRVNAIELEINTFETQIRSEFERLKEEQQAEFDELKRETEATISREVARLENLVNTAIQSLENEFNRLLTEVTIKINSLEAEIQRAIISLNNQLEANNQFIFAWVENRLQEFIDSFPEIVTISVYNPVRGEITDIQVAVNDLYSIASPYGLTAEQYDSLQLSAEEYDNYDLTAREYDQYGYKLLHYPDPDLYMISPFTGQQTLVKEVVYDLAHFHMNGLTASEYDAKDLTAEVYDALDLTAFNFDWFGKELIV